MVEQIQAANLLRPGDRVLWLAGRDYKDHVEALLPQIEHLDPMRGLGIGSRLGWLTRVIESPVDAIPIPSRVWPDVSPGRTRTKRTMTSCVPSMPRL